MLPEWIQHFLMNYGYVAVFLVLLICGLGLPLPEDIVLISGGILVGLGSANLCLMMLACYLGILIGDALMYGLGWHFDLREKRFFRRVLTPYRMHRIEQLFQKYGNRLIFIARFLPGLRAPIFVMTGMSHRVNLRMFLFMDGLAALLSAPLFILLGYYGAENHEWLLQQIKNFKEISIGVAVAALLLGAFFLHRHWQRKRFFRRELARRRQERQEAS